ncbi:hypothetical protein J2T55_001883 [Methylohalomonas lacus]|uniref:Uncharacterized protein n=1 Tax=Methylohalomonas lacus TaxID=398773 RepID=A0AAE3L222_9GAMM|nr:hypothetical protein [Methylohalomonas lacus]MCS3903851.1 hypothetical protein [Methylohalomonas lacus]
MTDSSTNPNVVRHQTAAQALRDHFMKWQCKARQNAVRKSSGKPSESMCPNLIAEDGVLRQIVALINKHESYSLVPELKHIVLRTQDPKKRYDSGLELLAAEYYQDRREFSDHLTALFGPEEPLVDYLAQQGSCVLEFDRTRQYYSLPCEVVNLDEEDYLFQATYWHNQLFNPYMPPEVQVLAFRPDWSRAVADPEPA